MHNKIKTLREYVKLSESEFSKITNISSYKYRRFESGTLTIPTEYMIIVSCAYDLSMDYLVFDKYSVEQVLQSNEIKGLVVDDKNMVVNQLERNICKHSSSCYDKPNYRVIKNILDAKIKNCSKNFREFRYELNMDTTEMALKLNMPDNSYIAIEQGKIFPEIIQLSNASRLFRVPIDNILN